MEPALRARVEHLLGDRVVDADRAVRGYTPAQRWRITLEDRRRAFVKVAVNELTAGWLRREQEVYAALHAEFLPKLLGWDDDGSQPMLALEDLGEGHWPPPWRTGDVEAVRRMLDRVHATQPLAVLPALRDAFPVDGWRTVANNPRPFLATGLTSETWVETALPALIEAEAGFRLDGDALVHNDVRSDNLCLRDERALLVDWNGAARGNPEIDVASWLPSLELEGGPPPESILPAAPEAAAVVSGYFAARAGLPPVPDAPGVRPIQRAQLGPALRWVARALHLPPVDTP